MNPSAPSRRLILGALATLLLAARPAARPLPAIAGPDPDAALIALCNRFVDLMTEAALLAHDEWTPDEGENHPRYQALCDQQSVVMREIEDAEPPTTLEGMPVMARAALTLIDRNHEGEITPGDISDVLSANLALGAAGDFVWPSPPRTHAGAPTGFRRTNRLKVKTTR